MCVIVVKGCIDLMGVFCYDVYLSYDVKVMLIVFDLLLFVVMSVLKVGGGKVLVKVVRVLVKCGEMCVLGMLIVLGVFVL